MKSVFLAACIFAVFSVTSHGDDAKTYSGQIACFKALSEGTAISTKSNFVLGKENALFVQYASGSNPEREALYDENKFNESNSPQKQLAHSLWTFVFDGEHAWSMTYPFFSSTVQTKYGKPMVRYKFKNNYYWITYTDFGLDCAYDEYGTSITCPASSPFKISRWKGFATYMTTHPEITVPASGNAYFTISPIKDPALLNSAELSLKKAIDTMADDFIWRRVKKFNQLENIERWKITDADVSVQPELDILNSADCGLTEKAAALQSKAAPLIKHWQSLRTAQ